MIKTVLFAALFIAAGFSAGAQITLTSANVPTPGLVSYLTDADSVSTAALNLGPGGANQTWNFSAIVAGSLPYPNYYLSPASTPFAASYPTATLASTYELSDTASYDYLRATTNGVWLLGSKSTSDVVNYTSPLKEISLPFTYQSTFSQTDTLNGTSGGYTFSGTESETVLADAWGMITTPLGTFPCLRIKRVSAQNLTVLIFTATLNTTSYEWWSTQHKSPVFTYTTTQSTILGTTTTSTNASYLSSETTATSEPGATAGQVTVFPNPARGTATLTFQTDTPGKADVFLYTADGKLALSDRGTQVQAGKTTHELNMQNLVPGTYMGMVMVNGKVIGVQQVVVY